MIEWTRWALLVVDICYSLCKWVIAYNHIIDAMSGNLNHKWVTSSAAR